MQPDELHEGRDRRYRRQRDLRPSSGDWMVSGRFPDGILFSGSRLRDTNPVAWAISWRHVGEGVAATAGGRIED